MLTWSRASRINTGCLMLTTTLRQPYEEDQLTSAVRDYWDVHTLGLQFVADPGLVVGSPEFFDHVRPWMNPFRFPEIMPRIDRNAKELKGKHLLEVGCGLGFESVEYMKRGVSVTATDLTPSAVTLAQRHFEIAGLRPEAVLVADVLNLQFADRTFDAVSATGVLHHTGDTPRAVREIHRVLKPGGRAILSHFYRKPSWMQFVSRLGRENIEFKDQDPPVTDFMTEQEILSMFGGFEIAEVVQDHYRILKTSRRGWKAALFNSALRPAYNLLPEPVAKRLAYKFSVTAVKPRC
jgi:ubiquinone/menaquinone biosynthesis C-methylase UbiE